MLDKLPQECHSCEHKAGYYKLLALTVPFNSWVLSQVLTAIITMVDVKIMLAKLNWRRSTRLGCTAVATVLLCHKWMARTKTLSQGEEACMVSKLAWSEDDLPWFIDPNMTLTRTCDKTLACIILWYDITCCSTDRWMHRAFVIRAYSIYVPRQNMRIFALTMKLTCKLQAWLQLDLEWHNINAPSCRLRRLLL